MNTSSNYTIMNTSSHSSSHEYKITHLTPHPTNTCIHIIKHNFSSYKYTIYIYLLILQIYNIHLPPHPTNIQ